MDMTKYSDKKYTVDIYLTLSGHQTYQSMLLCCVRPRGIPHLNSFDNSNGEGRIFLNQVLGHPVSPFFGQTRFWLVLLISPFYSHCISIIALWDPFNEFSIYIYIPNAVCFRVFWLLWTCNMRDVRQPWPCLRHAMAFQARSGIDSCNSMLSAYVTGHCRWLPKKWWGKFGDVHTPLGFSE